MREKEMQGLEQFFGMGIADRAVQRSTGVVDQVKAKVGFGSKKEPSQGDDTSGFPAVGSTFFPSQPTKARPKDNEPQEQEPEQNPYEGAGRSRHWTNMLGRLRADVDRICNFLEALAKHPRGLQKYHEEAVRTVHDAWIDREGVQSLRRWVRSECTRIWPHKFAAIETEKQRAQDDIRALEELFGGEADEGQTRPMTTGA